MKYNLNNKNINCKWQYTDKAGTFEWKNPHSLNQLYFPVCNEAGMMASVTPSLNGDATTGQHTFLRKPLVIEDLHNTRSARNFWIYNKELGAYSLTGNSAKQMAKVFTSEDNVDLTVKGTFLSHTLIREDLTAGIKSEIISFSPVTDDMVEIMWVKITNISDNEISFIPTTALPVYGRSAENLRDHNHWTSLAHRMKLNEYGMLIKPAINHDERGHKPNNTIYFVMAIGDNEEKPIGQFPTVAEFIGEGGNFEWPRAVVENISPYINPPNRRDGMEAVGAIRFKETSLAPKETKGYIIISGITENKDSTLKCVERYGSRKKIEKALDENFKYWSEKVDKISFTTGDKDFHKWMHWVALQPILRRIYGNSFLPHFDYGKGGRGWRDLWQDCLALIIQNPYEIRDSLVANFGGVRLDGSNATIIEKGLGKFSADRNKISRVWMDHGVWPYYTMKLYIEQTGDYEILFEEIPYWKDHQIRRAKAIDYDWKVTDGTNQKTISGEIYKGTVIEHIIVQHLICFYNVGDHNNMKLEDGDWNDLLDMANIKGETVPFSAFYGWNLITMSELLLDYMKLRNYDKIKVFPELLKLISTKEKIDYKIPMIKREILIKYFEAIENGFSGEKVEVSIEEIAIKLKEMGNWVLEHVRKSEWIESKTSYGFFNGYYNNDGDRVDGDHIDCTRMNLTAQTFAIMSGAATENQVLRTFQAVKAILKDENTGGFRLTTPLGPNTLNFGRGYAVVYGEKETGGTFNHMVVMFMNALYSRGYINEAYEVFKTINTLCNDTEKAKIYPGIPEYISHEGRGMYHYLSGSASWLLMTVLTEMFGIKGKAGNLLLKPKLVQKQFDESGIISAKTTFLGENIKVIYNNPLKLDYDEYKIVKIKLNESDVNFEKIDEKTANIKRSYLEIYLSTGDMNKIEVFLGK